MVHKRHNRNRQNLNRHNRIFREGSKTYYNSSRFFPKDIRDDVSVLYGFVRVADNFVDARPQQGDAFYRFREKYEKALSSNTPSGDEIIDTFIDLQHRRKFDPAWTEAFLRSMEIDLSKQVHENLEGALEYIYGSAEVIGFFMARIMGLPEEAMFAASRLGRAMQYINFIRDIDEDLSLGRQYLPTAGSDLPDLRKQTAEAHPEKFMEFIRREINRYRGWQREASEGYRLIPKQYRIPIMTAADMYSWTADIIGRDPFIVYEKKVKPPRPLIFFTGVRHAVRVNGPVNL